MIIVYFFRRVGGWGLGFFFIMILILLLGNKFEDMKNTIKYDTEWVEPKDIWYGTNLEVGESVSYVLKSKDSDVYFRFLMNEDYLFYKVEDCHLIKKKWNWYYYNVTVKYVKEDPEQDGAWLFGIASHASNPKLGHGEDWIKLNRSPKK